MEELYRHKSRAWRTVCWQDLRFSVSVREKQGDTDREKHRKRMLENNKEACLGRFCTYRLRFLHNGRLPPTPARKACSAMSRLSRRRWSIQGRLRRGILNALWISFLLTACWRFPYKYYRPMHSRGMSIFNS